MDNDKREIIWCAVIWCLIMVLAGLGIGYGITSRYYKAQAIKHGAAEWVIINEGGDTEFRWKDRK